MAGELDCEGKFVGCKAVAITTCWTEETLPAAAPAAYVRRMGARDSGRKANTVTCTKTNFHFGSNPAVGWIFKARPELEPQWS